MNIEPFTKKDLALVFNEWMRKFTEDPTAFTREFEAVIKFLDEEAEGIEPSYGLDCANYLYYLRDNL